MTLFVPVKLKLHYAFDFPLKKGSDGKEYMTVRNSNISIASVDDLKSDLKGFFSRNRLLGN